MLLLVSRKEGVGNNMVHLWAKVMKVDKIVKDHVLQKSRFHMDKFEINLAELMQLMDLPTPIVLKTHLSDIDNYSRTVFSPSDFIEPVSFTRLVLEIY